MGTIVPAWSNAQKNTFLVTANATNIGASNPQNANGPFTAGFTAYASLGVWTNGGGDPGVPVAPTGFVQVRSAFINDFRGTVWERVLDGTESGSFATSWAGAAVCAAWGLNVFSYTGTPPATPRDTDGVNAVNSGASTNMVAASISPTLSNDLLFAIFMESTGGQAPYTKPSDMTLLSDVNAASLNCEILASYKNLSASGPTGTETATFTGGSFKDTINFMLALKPGVSGGVTAHARTLVGVGS